MISRLLVLLTIASFLLLKVVHCPPNPTAPLPTTFPLKINLSCPAVNQRISNKFKEQGEILQKRINEIILCVVMRRETFSECIDELNLDLDRFLISKLKEVDRTTTLQQPKLFENYLKDIFDRYCTFLNSGNAGIGNSRFQMEDLKENQTAFVIIGICLIFIIVISIRKRSNQTNEDNNETQMKVNR